MKKLLDGSKNAVLQFSGSLDPADGPKHLFRLAELEGSPTVVKLQAILYSFEGKGQLLLDDGDQIPLAGRGKMDFEQFHAIPVKESIYIVGSGDYFLMIDLEKQ